jgi:hypothetical protein
MNFTVRALTLKSLCLFGIFAGGSTIAYAQTTASPTTKTQEVQSYRAGKKSILIPSPSSDLSEMGPDYRVVLETYAPATNRLIAAFTRPEDVQSILVGRDAPLPRYGMVEVLRRAEFSDIDAATFKSAIVEMGKQFGVNSDIDFKEQQDELNRNLKSLNSGATTISIDKPLPLGQFFCKTDACGFGLVMEVSAKGSSTKLISCVTILRVQNRFMYLFLYSVYKDESSAQWVRKTSEEWADAVLAANK